MDKIELYTYSYNELFELIKTQQEKEEREKKKKEKLSKTAIFLNESLRAINNPTTQNLQNTFNILLNTKEEEKADDRTKYVYIAPKI